MPPGQMDEESGPEEAPSDRTTSQPPPAKPKSGSLFRSVAEFIGILAAAILIAYLLQAFIVKPFQIPSESMEPTIDPGDRILVNRLAYSYGSIERGDVIVFKAPTDPDVDFVKRVIALGGDTIEVKNGQVFINGVAQAEPYAPSMDFSNFPAQTVPEGNLFVMGDNRGDSQDSRFWNPPWLPVENVVGEAFLIYWPPSRIGGL